MGRLDRVAAGIPACRPGKADGFSSPQAMTGSIWRAEVFPPGWKPGSTAGRMPAATGVSRARMHQLERDGDKKAGHVNRLIENQETMIGSVLLGNNVINRPGWIYG